MSNLECLRKKRYFKQTSANSPSCKTKNPAKVLLLLFVCVCFNIIYQQFYTRTVLMLCIIATPTGYILEDGLWISSDDIRDMDREEEYVYSAVKIDVSEISPSCISKVLVLSHESTARDVTTTLLKKLKMRDQDCSNFVIEAELITTKEIAILQFEDDDKPMHAYEQFPKGSLSFYLRHKMDMEISSKTKRDGELKANLNGHQITIQRIRRSLEKLKRKSNASSSGSTVSSSRSTGNINERMGRKISTSPNNPKAGVTSTHIMSTSSGTTGGGSMPPASVTVRSKPMSPPGNNHLIRADEFYKEPRREHRGRQGRTRRHHSDSQPPTASSSSTSTTPRTMYSPSRSESMHLYKTPYSPSSSVQNYKTSTLPQGGTIVSMDNDCMIFYDSSDTGSIHSMPVPLSHHQQQHFHHSTTAVSARAHVMPTSHHHHKSEYNSGGVKQGVMIDKPQKMSFRNLEDSGIDVKSPPHLNNSNGSNGHCLSNGPDHNKVSSNQFHLENQVNLNDSNHEQSKHINGGASQESNPYLSPTVSDYSPFSLLNGMENIKRSGSFSSMKSLPVSAYKDNSTPNSFLFEPIEQNQLRSKSQSCTNLNKNKVVRRRSLPPLDVSQEKLEQKKTSLSKRLARKINKYRENEKRYVLPSPHSFTPQSLQNYKDHAIKQKTDPDDMSLADMEVANILEGKPEHPTDSDVEDYLACVESTDNSRDGDSVSQASYTAHSEKKVKNSIKTNVKNTNSHTIQPKENHKSVDMEKSGYHRYSNSAKLERQQKQLAQQNNETVKNSHMSPFSSKSDAGKSHHVSPNQGPVQASGHKPKKSLNKFVEQSMQSFLDHCHDVNMVGKHDTLDLHQAALHGQFPPGPVRNKADPKSVSPQKEKPNTGYNEQFPASPVQGKDKVEPVNHKRTHIPKPNSVVSHVLNSLAMDSHSKDVSHVHDSHSTDNPVKHIYRTSISLSNKPEVVNHDKKDNNIKGISNISNNTETIEQKTSNKHRVQQNNTKYDFSTGFPKQAQERKSESKSHQVIDEPSYNENTSHKVSKYLVPKTTAEEHRSNIKSQEELDSIIQDRTSVNTNKVQSVDTTDKTCSDLPGAIEMSPNYESHKPTEIKVLRKDIILDSDSNSTTSSTRNIRRGSQSSDNTVHSQNSRDKYQNNLEHDDDILGKPLTLFTIIKSHNIFAVFIEKGDCKSYGIQVKRDIFSPLHHQAWVGEIANGVTYNVVVVKEVVANLPAGTSGLLASGDVVIEVNGHSVLQSSDKVVRTLLDARSSLEMVVARAKHGGPPPTTKNNTNNNHHTTDMQPSMSNNEQLVVFDNMEDINCDSINDINIYNTKSLDNVITTNGASTHRGKTYHHNSGDCDNSSAISSRSRAYQTIYGEEQTSNIICDKFDGSSDSVGGGNVYSPTGPEFLL